MPCRRSTSGRSRQAAPQRHEQSRCRFGTPGERFLLYTTLSYIQIESLAAAKAQLIELINDELGLLAALVGTLFVMWGKPLADPLAAIFVATIIAINAVGLFRQNLSFLLGRAPEPQLMDAIRQAVRSTPGVLSVHNLRAEMIGPEAVHTTLHIEIRRGTPIEEADVVATEVKARIHKLTDNGYCVVHVDPEGSQPAETLHDPRTGELTDSKAL